MDYEVVGMRKEGDEIGYMPNMRMHTYIPCLAVVPPTLRLPSSVLNEEGLWAHVATFTLAYLVRRDI